MTTLSLLPRASFYLDLQRWTCWIVSKEDGAFFFQLPPSFIGSGSLRTGIRPNGAPHKLQIDSDSWSRISLDSVLGGWGQRREERNRRAQVSSITNSSPAYPQDPVPISLVWRLLGSSTLPTCGGTTPVSEIP